MKVKCHKYDLKHHPIFKQVVTINEVNPIKEVRQKMCLLNNMLIIYYHSVNVDVSVDVFIITGH